MKEASAQAISIETRLIPSHGKQRNSHGKNGTSLILVLVLVVVALVGVIALQQETNSFVEIDMLIKEKTQLEDEFQTLEEEIEYLDSMRKLITQCQNPASTKALLDNIRKDEETPTLSHSVTILENEIINQARRSALRKYGEGPYRVEMQIEFPGGETPERMTEIIVIEMAPLDMMPYTVSFFLDRVSEGFYNGHTFTYNAGHVVIATTTGRKDQTLVNAIIQEHNPNYPHLHYTLGFTKLEKGNNFYISTEDNSVRHGNAKETGFAKIVEGFDTVDRLHKMKDKHGGFGILKEFVTVKNANILGLDGKSE